MQLNPQIKGDYSLDDFEIFIGGMNETALIMKLDELHNMMATMPKDDPNLDFIVNCYMSAESELERRAGF